MLVLRLQKKKLNYQKKKGISVPFFLSCVDKKDAALKALQRNGFRPPCFFSSLFLKNTLGNANPLPCQCRIIFRLFCIVQIALIL